MDPKELIERLHGGFLSWLRMRGHHYFAHLVEQAAAALTALTEENDKIWDELEQVKRDRDAAAKETERMKSIMREHGIMVIPSKYPGGKSEWNVPPRGPRKEE